MKVVVIRSPNRFRILRFRSSESIPDSMLERADHCNFAYSDSVVTVVDAPAHQSKKGSFFFATAARNATYKISLIFWRFSKKQKTFHFQDFFEPFHFFQNPCEMRQDVTLTWRSIAVGPTTTSFKEWGRDQLNGQTPGLPAVDTGHRDVGERQSVWVRETVCPVWQYILTTPFQPLTRWFTPQPRSLGCRQWTITFGSVSGVQPDCGGSKLSIRWWSDATPIIPLLLLAVGNIHRAGHPKRKSLTAARRYPHVCAWMIEQFCQPLTASFKEWGETN